MSDSRWQERAEDLEIRVSYQEKLLSDLDEVVRGFARRVELLESEVKSLREGLGSQEMGPANDKPPHY